MHYDNYNLHCVISIHALLAESDDTWVRGSRVTYVISIHALLAESDLDRWLAGLKGTLFLSTLSLRRATRKGFAMRWNTCISIHALLAESDAKNTSMAGRITLFLSTLSLRRATLAGPSGPAFLFNFYPRSPCGERRKPRALKSRRMVFLSTLSLRRATHKGI